MTGLPGRVTTAVVVTVSDSASAGLRDDASGAAVAKRLAELGWSVDRVVVPDERGRIAAAIVSATGRARLVVTTGGTGLAPRDVTPEATLDVVERVVLGLAEAMRAAGRATTPFADLGRGIAGTRGDALVVNLPGSLRGALESLGAIEAALPHALDTLAGPYDHDAPLSPGGGPPRGGAPGGGPPPVH